MRAEPDVPREACGMPAGLGGAQSAQLRALRQGEGHPHRQHEAGRAWEGYGQGVHKEVP